MDNRYPLMLFCFPALALVGAVAEPLQDGTYGTRTVASEDEHAAAMSDGWQETPADARAAHADRIAAEQAATLGSVNTEPDDNAPPTRAELEAKATELQIRFDKRTSDKALSDRIAAALEP
jgi:hypothetical protein